jgi:signal peptidase I
MSRPVKLLVAVGMVPALVFVCLIVMRLLGLVCPFYIPNSGMAPALAPRDHVVMEGFSFLQRKPRRGDILVFKAEGISMLPAGSTYVKRVVGLPGEHLRLANDRLYINEVPAALTNATGQISYLTLTTPGLEPAFTDITIPAGRYFLIGDNTTNSLDSRYWGCLPAKNIKGRICFCYWPPQRIGLVR